MLDSLKLIHLHGYCGDVHRDINTSGAFVLETCQRTIVLTTFVEKSPLVSHELLEGEHAYRFLLETICGLKSILKGESEIVSQFKSAYSNYLDQSHRSKVIMKVLEKLFKDAKDIRSNFLKEIGQQSYTGIAKKILVDHSKGKKVLILGSGKLAKDAIRNLSKKFDIYVSARNDQKVKEIKKEFKGTNIHVIDWLQKEHYLSFDSIINTIGAKIALFDEEFFRNFDPDRQLFIDLGSPSIVQTSMSSDDGVYKLEDIFNHGKELDEAKNQKISRAQLAIQDAVDRRRSNLRHSYPISWGELEFL